MASVFISTPAQIVLIDSRTRSGTITLPVTNQIQYRVVSFKDQYGSFSNSTMTLSTQFGEAFDDGTTTKTFSNAFTSINLYAGSTTRWMVMNATQSVQQTISSLITNQLIFGTGAGWAQFGPVQATVLSSIQQTTNLSFITLLSTNQGLFSSIGVNCNAPGVILDVFGTTRSLSTITSSITLASGAGWTTTGALQAVALSSIQLNTALGFVSTLYVGSTTTQLQGYTARINGLALISSMIVGQPTSLVSTSGAALLSLTRDAASKPGTTTWGIPSDLRIKENIVNADLDRCYHDIRSVPLRRFSYKPWFYNAVQGHDKHVLGFIAQEVSSIIPKVVTTENAYGFSDFNVFNIDQLNMSLYGAVKKTISDKEVLESTVKGQRLELTTLQGTTSVILSTLEGLQGR
jgi:hypothetical protein